MAGGIRGQYSTLTSILQCLQEEPQAKKDLVKLLRERLNLSDSFARKLCSVLFVGTGLVIRKRNLYSLSELGAQFTRSPTPVAFYELLSLNFVGTEIILRIIQKSQPTPWETLRERWAEEMRRTHQEVRKWSSQHLSSQLRFRVDWLRSLGLVNYITGKYVLTEEGLRQERAAREAAACSEDEKQTISHNDLEDKLTLIGAFFQFEVKKRATINQMLPPSNRRLSEDRQVDCLWVRFVHFGGKLQYPFEVQISGNMADAIERLEMVANVVQKAVVVTDEKQQKRMLDRLKVKRSLLLDKVMFVTPDEVDKVVEAAAVMKSFTDQLFQE